MLIKSSYPPLPTPPPTNLHNLLFRRPDLPEFPDHVMHIDASTGQKRTRSEFLERVYDGATALGAPISEGGLGLPDGSLVGILSDNCLDYIVLVHSLLAITTPFALIQTHSTASELEHFLKTSKATHIFVHADLLSETSETLKAYFPDERIYILEGADLGRTSFGGLINGVKSEGIARVSVREPKKDALAYLVFSSGTGGLPKAVMITQDNLRWSIMQLVVVGQVVAAALPPTPPQATDVLPVHLSVLPWYHSYGFNMSMFRMFPPITLVILPRWNIDLALHAITQYRVSVLALVPSLIHQIVHSPKFQNTDLTNVVTVYCGAAHLPTQFAEKLAGITPNATGGRLGEGYGMSECTMGALGKPVPGMLGFYPVPGCTGLIFPAMEARIIREDGSEADFDEPGELLLKGPNVSLGYWNNEKATKDGFLPGGWLKTGDQFRVKKTGLFFFEDRSKDTLKVSGHQVAPKEIEDILLSHPEHLLVDAAVAGVSGGRMADEKVPRAWVVLSAAGRARGEAAVRHELQVWEKKNLSRYKWLRGGIEFVDVIPKSATGKVLRRALQEQFAQRSAAQAKL